MAWSIGTVSLAASAASALLLTPAGPAAAQDYINTGIICANRPGKITPTCTVPTGRVQVEVGLYETLSDRNNGVATHVYSAADIGVRLGLTESIEVQASVTPYTLVRQRNTATGARTRNSGAGDVTLAVRAALMRTGALSVAVQPYVVAPTGANGIGTGEWQAGLILPFSYSLSPRSSLFFSPGAAWVPDRLGGGHHVSYSGALGVSYGIGQVALGAEVWAQFNDDPAGEVTQTSAGLTAAWVPNWMPTLQFDAGVHAGLNDDTPDLEAYVGVSKRF